MCNTHRILRRKTLNLSPRENYILQQCSKYHSGCYLHRKDHWEKSRPKMNKTMKIAIIILATLELVT